MPSSLDMKKEGDKAYAGTRVPYQISTKVILYEMRCGNGSHNYVFP